MKMIPILFTPSPLFIQEIVKSPMCSHSMKYQQLNDVKCLVLI